MKRLFLLSAGLLVGVTLTAGYSDSSDTKKALKASVTIQADVPALKSDPLPYMVKTVVAEVGEVFVLDAPELGKAKTQLFFSVEKFTKVYIAVIRPPPKSSAKNQNIKNYTAMAS